MQIPIWNVYEITPDCRRHGRLKKTFRNKTRAIRYMEQSIYRFIKESEMIIS